MRKIKLAMKALSHEGFGKSDYYKEQVQVDNDTDAIKQAIINFALKYGVEFESVQIEEISNGNNS